MKRLFVIAAVLLLVVTFSGCLSTLHPLFTAKDLIFDARLAGQWTTGDSGTVIRYERGSVAAFKDQPAALQQLADRSYVVTVTNNDGEVVQKYLGFLLRIGANMYMDYYPVRTPKQQTYASLYMQQLIPMHTIYRLRFKNDKTFDASQFDQDYLVRLLKQKQLRIRHEEGPNGIVVTAPTEELQQYVLKYGDVPEAYEDASTYRKLQ